LQKRLPRQPCAVTSFSGRLLVESWQYSVIDD